MNSNQDANWCVTKPWFDYILGTRVISSLDLHEQNPLGIALPQVVSKQLTQWVNQVFPAKWVKAPEAIPLNSAQTTEMVAG